MTKNPLVNAGAAYLYIVVLTLGMNLASKQLNGPDSALAPIAFLSLFTFSAGFMGYVFCYTPLMLYFDGKKKLATQLFLQTLLSFGAFTLISLIVIFSRILPF